MIEQGKRYLITTNDWFYSPDGESCKAAWGTCEIMQAQDAFGFTPARPSTNWFMKVGTGDKHIMIAGCQIHYAIRCEDKPKTRHADASYKDKDTGLEWSVDRIYYAE